jgi:hypothetical protein
MTAVLAPDLPVIPASAAPLSAASPSPSSAAPASSEESASAERAAGRSWLGALPRPADVATSVGWLGEWIGHASLEPARVILRWEVPEPFADPEVLEARCGLGAAYAAVAAVAGGATGLVGGVLGAGRWAGLVSLAGAFGIENLLTTATCVRAVSHVGARYGFVVRSEDERVAVLTVVAESLGGRAAPGDRRHLAAVVVTRLSVHRGPTELVRLLPAMGPAFDAAIGAVLAARLLARVVDDADRHYRARYLAERVVASSSQ